MSKRTVLLILAVVFIGTIFVIGMAVVQTSSPELKDNLDIYDGANLLFEDSAVYGADVSQKSLYYWSDDSIDVVKAYYEQAIGTFESSEDQSKEWFIAAIAQEELHSSADPPSSFLTHQSFCPDIRDESCISIVLVDAGQSDLYTLPVMSPSGFRRSTIPNALQGLNSDGTLIIFNYWVE